MNTTYDTIKPLYEEMGTVAGQLWHKGWAERNAGNLSIRLPANQFRESDFVEKTGPFVLPEGISFSEDAFILITGAGRRMRDVAENARCHTLLVQVQAEAGNYWLQFAASLHDLRPTSELATHLACHALLMKSKPGSRAVLHAHPTELICLTHVPGLAHEAAINQVLWKMQPETALYVPQGIGYVPYQMAGNVAIAQATLQNITAHDAVLWGWHGAFCIGRNLHEAFDTLDVLNKSAGIYLRCRAAGFEPEGLSDAQVEQIRGLSG